MSLTTLEQFEKSGIIILNDEKRKNKASRELFEGLLNLLEQCENNEKITGIIITGVNDSFCAGADLKEAADIDNFIDYVQYGKKVINKIFNYKKPVIAALNGFAFGGGLELALSCDLIYSTMDIMVGLPEVSLGMYPGWGGTQLLIKRIGPGLAKEIIFTGKKIAAEDAWEIGLIDRIFDNGNTLIYEALNTLKLMSENCPQAIYKAKEMINLYYKMPTIEGLKTELSEFTKWIQQEYATEGINAFFEKRDPNWKT